MSPNWKAKPISFFDLRRQEILKQRYVLDSSIDWQHQTIQSKDALKNLSIQLPKIITILTSSRTLTKVGWM